jgi:tetratricopeptide (TPR) repeat protein
MEALVLDGLANALRDRGNIPSARELWYEGLSAANESGDGHAIAQVNHGLMSLENDAGRLGRAVAHGWTAVRRFPREEDRYNALVSLAGCFVKMGELDAAEDAYAIVAERGVWPDWRFAALEMLAHVAALRGDRAEFDVRFERMERSGWREGASTATQAQILQYHGLSWRALGETAAAITWLERARDCAREHGINRVFFECEAALAGLESARAAPAAASCDAPAEAALDDALPASELEAILGGVGALRRELAPV